jgi:NADPH:quinone reductase-like Zn-dependent oxidoreductase
MTVNEEKTQTEQQAAVLAQLTKKKKGWFGKKAKRDQNKASAAGEERNEDGDTTAVGNSRGYGDDNRTDYAEDTPEANVKTSPSNGSGSLFRLADKRQKKVVFTKVSSDPNEAIEVQTQDIPEPVTRNHVVIKVNASTVSLYDALVRRGVSYELMDFPVTPGVSVVGTIKSVGDNVKNWKIGDRVCGLVRLGGNARYCNVLGENLVALPRSVDSAEASSLVSTYMTAYQSLKLVTNDNFSLDGKCVLVTGVLDPVGQALVQLCQRAGASEVYAAAPTERHKYVKGVLGAHPLAIDQETWPSLVKGRMHAVFDGDCLEPYNALTSDGILVSLGEAALMKQESSPGFLGAPISAYWAHIKGNIMPNTKAFDLWDSFLQDKNAFKLDFEILLHLLKKRFLKPHIAKRITLEEVVEAHMWLENDSPRGEIVCLPWKSTSSTRTFGLVPSLGT